MTFQFSTVARNAALDAIENAVGTGPTLELRSGSAPANCAAADSGTVLATLALPSDWMAGASGGSKAMAGTWQDTSADAPGTVGHFRIKQGGVCHLQGSVTAMDGSGDMKLDNPILASGQTVTISAFTLTVGGA